MFSVNWPFYLDFIVYIYNIGKYIVRSLAKYVMNLAVPCYFLHHVLILYVFWKPDKSLYLMWMLSFCLSPPPHTHTHLLEESSIGPRMGQGSCFCFDNLLSTVPRTNRNESYTHFTRTDTSKVLIRTISTYSILAF